LHSTNYFTNWVFNTAWANAVNTVLERENHTARVDHRSYERQGIEQIPTIHLGVAAHQMEQKGIGTDRGNINREIRLAILQTQRLQKELRDLKHWAKRESPKYSTGATCRRVRAHFNQGATVDTTR